MDTVHDVTPPVHSAGGFDDRLVFILRVYCILFCLLGATVATAVLFLRAGALAGAATAAAAAAAVAVERAPDQATAPFDGITSYLDRLLRQRRRRKLQGIPAGDATATCRICQEGSTKASDQDEGEFQQLARFCECRGSLAYVHRSCLERWRARQRVDRCELCGTQYFVEKDPEPRTATQAFLRLVCRGFVERVQHLRNSTDQVVVCGYALTACLVWLWLGCTKDCDVDVVDRLREMLTHCTLDTSASGWLRSSLGSGIIGAMVHVLVVVGAACGRAVSARIRAQGTRD